MTKEIFYSLDSGLFSTTVPEKLYAKKLKLRGPDGKRLLAKREPLGFQPRSKLKKEEGGR